MAAADRIAGGRPSASSEDLRHHDARLGWGCVAARQLRGEGELDLAADLEGLGDIPDHTDGNELSYKGWHPALSPKFVWGLQTSYDFYFKKWGVLTPYLQTTYASSYYANDANLAGVKQDSHNRTDIRVIWRTPNEQFRLQFYYLNFEDDATLNWARVYSPAARPEITTLQGNWNNPNTYGIIFDFTF